MCIPEPVRTSGALQNVYNAQLRLKGQARSQISEQRSVCDVFESRVVSFKIQDTKSGQVPPSNVDRQLKRQDYTKIMRERIPTIIFQTRLTLRKVAKAETVAGRRNGGSQQKASHHIDKQTGYVACEPKPHVFYSKPPRCSH